MPPVKGKRKTLTPQPAPPGVADERTGSDRPVVYPEPVVKEYRRVPDGDFSLTAADARDILGWEEETEDVKFGEDHVRCLLPLVGRKVRLVHNTRNRPIDVPWLLTLRQEHLNRRWRMNWETIVVSKTRQVNSGQHRLISLVLAELERLRDLQDERHWVKNWPGPVTMESLVVFGAEEDDETFRTLNCGRAMSYSDVLFRSSLLARFEPDRREKLAKAIDFAVRVLWDRTGLGKDPYAPRRTHGESDRFLLGHTRLVRAAEHVLEETSGNPAARSNLSVGPGTAAALLYLFAASGSDPRAWRQAAVPDETLLDLGHWDRAEEFFSLLVGNSPSLRAVRSALGLVDDPAHGCGTSQERTDILVRAWNVFRDGSDPGPADCRLEYEEDEDGGLKQVGGHPDVGGIDRGPGGGSSGAPAPVPPPADDEAPRPVPSRRQREQDDKARATRLNDVDRSVLNGIREEHAGKVLLFRSRKGDGWRAFEQDAKLLARLCGLVPVRNGTTQVAFSNDRCSELVAALQGAGHRVAAVHSTGDGYEVTDYDPPEPPADPPPNGKSRKPAKSKK